VAERAPSGQRRAEAVMGMRVAVDVRDAGVDPAALARVFAWLRWVDAAFSPYRRDSEVSRLGRGELAAADAHPLVAGVLERCEALRERTGGCFDARAVHGRLDPSGLVKGWAVQRAVGLLEAAGARDLCVDAGGDVVVRGGPAPGAAWRVGIRHPGRRDRLAAVLTLTDAAVATSGTYERGEHIVDPRTGRPPRGVRSVTVVGPDLADADAYATAAFAMGADGPAWTATLAGYDAMTVLDGGRVRSTPGFLRHCGGVSVAASLRPVTRRSAPPAGPRRRGRPTAAAG
jgi:thiamine biosynthesis lipoprotein